MHWRRGMLWLRRSDSNRQSRRVAGALAALAGVGLLLAALPGWLWAAVAGTALLLWGLALLSPDR